MNKKNFWEKKVKRNEAKKRKQNKKRREISKNKEGKKTSFKKIRIIH